MNKANVVYLGNVLVNALNFIFIYGFILYILR